MSSDAGDPLDETIRGTHPRFEPERWPRLAESEPHEPGPEPPGAADVAADPLEGLGITIDDVKRLAWLEAAQAELEAMKASHAKIIAEIDALDAAPLHVRKWFIKQTRIPFPGIDPFTRARSLLDVAHRMMAGESPFVDSQGQPVEWSYLDDNGWPRAYPGGRLVDIPIIPTQALRDDRARFVRPEIFSQARAMAEDIAADPVPGTGLVSFLRRVWKWLDDLIWQLT